MFLFDVFATIVVLSHEPGITAKDTFVYRAILLPGTPVLSAMPAIVLNVALAAVSGWLLSKHFQAKN
jgi:hypothetical protein